MCMRSKPKPIALQGYKMHRAERQLGAQKQTRVRRVIKARDPAPTGTAASARRPSTRRGAAPAPTSFVARSRPHIPDRVVCVTIERRDTTEWTVFFEPVNPTSHLGCDRCTM